MDFIETCRKFISFDTSLQSGNKELAEFAATLCREKGLSVELQYDSIGDQDHANIIVRHQESRPASEFLLQTHLDTVDPGPYRLWSKNGSNPFDATIYENTIYGLGAADVKLDFLCKLEAISSFAKDSPWKLPPVLVGTYGEEAGMLGMLKLIRKNKISAKMALVGEASDLKVIYAGKGYASVEIKIPFNESEMAYLEEHNLQESSSTQSKIFMGKSAHSSVPHLGDNAINKMFDYIVNLPEGIMLMHIDGGDNHNTVASHASLEIDIVAGSQNPILKKLTTIYEFIKRLQFDFLNYSDKDFNPSTPTLNIGLVRTFADHILLGGSCRIPPVVTNEIYEEWMKSFKSVCESVGAEFRILDYKKPYRTHENSILFRGCMDELRALGLPAESMTQPSINEASLLSRIGVECISFGPGKREGNIHTPQEHVSIEDLYKAIEFYKKSIERFCL